MKLVLKISLLLVLAALCGAGILQSRRASEEQSLGAKELFSVVTRQLTDFRTANFKSAYDRSALGIQRKFSPVQFESMVRQNYSAMTEAGEIEFGGARVYGTTALAQVFLTAPDGSAHIFVYSFSAEDGGWKIDGVQSLGTAPAGRLPGMRL